MPKIKEEEYIISESQEISLVQNPLIKGFFHAFPALRHRNYRLYFIGQLLSLVGTWIQIVAFGWLVFQLTKSAFMVGLVSSLGGLPVLIFGLFGGVIVDRFAKRKILIFTQISSMILAFILGLLTISGVITVLQIIILAFALGLISAIDIPARHAFVIEMVGKKDMASAIALNAGVFSGARVIGPAMAGAIIAAMGEGVGFVLNGFSYIPFIIVLFLIFAKSAVPSFNLHPFKAIKHGIAYSFSQPSIKMLLVFVGVASIFGWSYSTILPVVAEKIFHAGASGFGYLHASGGLGAVLAAILVSAYTKKVNPAVFIFGGSFLSAISLFLFTLTSNIQLAFVFLFLVGFGLTMKFATINSTIQHMVDNRLRGRVMSIYTLMFLGMSPIGSFQIGFFAEHFGSPFAIRLGAIIVFLFALLFYFNRKKIIQPLVF